MPNRSAWLESAWCRIIFHLFLFIVPGLSQHKFSGELWATSSSWGNLTSSPWEYARAHNLHDQGQCDNDFLGLGWLDKLRNRELVCGSNASFFEQAHYIVEPLPPTRIECRFSAEAAFFSKGPVPEAFCGAQVLALDLHRYHAYATNTPEWNQSGSVTETEEETDQGPEPFFIASCDLNRDKWEDSRFGNGGQRLLYSQTEVHAEGDGKPPPICVAVVGHPVYIIHDLYDTTANVWHMLEAIVHAFESFAAWGWAAADAQVVVADNVAEELLMLPRNLTKAERGSLPYFGRFGQLWAALFSGRHPPTTLRRLADSASACWTQQHSRQPLPPHAAVCFKHVVFGVHGGVSPISRSINKLTACRGSPVINGVSDMLVEALQLPPQRMPLQVEDLQQLMTGEDRAITWVSTAPPLSQQAPSAVLQEFGTAATKNPVDGSAGGVGNSRRMLLLWASRKGFKRQLSNEQQVLEAIAKEFGHVLDVMEVRFDKITVEQQMRLVRHAHVLAGLHGSSLAHSLALPRGSVLLEVQGHWRGEHFKNMAVWRDLYFIRYKDVQTSDDGEEMLIQDLPLFLAAVQLAMLAAGHDTADLASALPDVSGLPGGLGCMAEVRDSLNTAMLLDCHGKELSVVPEDKLSSIVAPLLLQQRQ